MNRKYFWLINLLNDIIKSIANIMHISFIKETIEKSNELIIVNIIVNYS